MLRIIRRPRKHCYAELVDGSVPLMQDTRETRTDMRALAQHAHGRVLLSGLGLGILARYCAARPQVRSVDVIEVRLQLALMLAPHLPAKVRLIVGDARTLIPTFRAWPWDLSIFDFHGDDSAWHAQHTILPLRLAVESRFGPRKLVFFPTAWRS